MWPFKMKPKCPTCGSRKGRIYPGLDSGMYVHKTGPPSPMTMFGAGGDFTVYSGVCIFDKSRVPANEIHMFPDT